MTGSARRLGGWRALTALLVALMGAACAGDGDSEESSASAEWVGSVTTEGAVTTVVNESGSVWGGAAQLVEEVSIGVGEGAEEHMLGSVASVWADDERFYVLDSQIPALRIYDRSGEYVMSVGRPGEGPGEFSEVLGVASLSDGTIVVAEAGGRLHWFDADGEVVRTQNTGAGWVAYGQNFFLLSADETPYKVDVDMESLANRDLRMGRRPFYREGEIGETLFPPPLEQERQCLEYVDSRNGRERTHCNVPQAPFKVEVMTPELAWIVGVSDAYGFTIHPADGGRIEVSRVVEPIPIAEAQREYLRAETVGVIRQWDPEWAWRGPDVPTTQRAYEAVYPDRNGRVWVRRQGPSRRVDGPCTEDFSDYRAIRNEIEPCWVSDGFLDAFDRDGRYLGELAMPEDLHLFADPFIDGDELVATTLDANGVVRVRQYRIVIAGGDATS